MNYQFLRPLAVICLLGFLVSSVAAQGAKQETLKVGDQAPDFEIKTFGDATIKLSDRFGDDGKPTILLFSRASW